MPTNSVLFVLGVYVGNKYVRDRKLRGKAKVDGIYLRHFLFKVLIDGLSKCTIKTALGRLK